MVAQNRPRITILFFFVVAAKAELRFRRQKTEQVSNLLLDDLAEHLGTSWRELGTILEIHEKVLEYFDRENECFRDKGIAMLHEWKRLSGNAATVKILKEALEKIGMSHLLKPDEGTHSQTELIYKRVSMGWWLLRLSAKILAFLRLSVNFFQLRLTKKLKINFFCFKSQILINLYFWYL